MKKQFTLLPVLCIYCFSYSQNNIVTKLPCTDVMAQEAKGRWIKIADVGSYNSKETNNRLDEIQNMILKIYPQPAGVDAVWHCSAGVGYFGSKRNYRKTNDERLTFDYLNLPHFIHYSYTAGFFAYRCEYNKTHSLVPGSPGETGTWINIVANGTLGEMASDDDWTINGLPVITKKPALKKEDGYESLYSEPGSSNHHVIVYRKGILPYIPVTRKQYLDYCILYHAKLHNEMIKGVEQMPVRSLEEQEKEKKAKLEKFQKQFGNDPKKLKSAVDYYLSGYKTDQQMREERIVNAKKNKSQELKKFTDELEKTTKEGLLDIPAMVRVKYYSTPVFETDSAYGLMLITENSDYIRKSLSKYAPQHFVVTWVWNDWLPQKRIDEIMRQDFPFDKLQSMIDK